MKRCSGCHQLLPLDAFNRHSKSKDGHQAYCRECGRRYKDGRPGRHRAERYGMTPAQYDALSAIQGSRCAVCGADQPGGSGAWHVDHDHVTGEVWGLLCLRCNAGIGQLGDDPARLRAAADYLEHPPAQEAHWTPTTTS